MSQLPLNDVLVGECQALGTVEGLGGDGAHRERAAPDREAGTSPDHRPGLGDSDSISQPATAVVVRERKQKEPRSGQREGGE